MKNAGGGELETVTRFYKAFQNRDAAAMAACYHPQASFSDPVFGPLSCEDVKMMWAMLCHNGKDLRINFDVAPTPDSSIFNVQWQADYTFSGTGRFVVNRVSARMRFADGKIIEHKDRFSFWAWSRQALGASGMLLGWTPLLKLMLRKKAKQSLRRFRESAQQTESQA